MFSDDYSRVLTVIGLLASLGGVIILFRWGMPFRAPSGGYTTLAGGPASPAVVKIESIYAICGWVGLCLLILGAALQILATLMPPIELPK
jgi:hypothetical protein